MRRQRPRRHAHPHGLHEPPHRVRRLAQQRAGARHDDARCAMSGFESIEERLDNWGATVRSPRFKPEVCAQWARLHVALRDKALAEMPIPPEQKDGWLVEAAWSAMPNHVAKWVLKYTYVWRMAPDQVQTRMRKAHGAVLRGRRFELVLADAHRAISQSIVKLTADSVIRKIASTGCKPPESVL
ncbi:hypothetical protein BDAG_01682 [Burkholderia dolosa AU0158]|nr:hypothetical protein BDAG_01682 [Burkholderia dolosa AU0158]